MGSKETKTAACKRLAHRRVECYHSGTSYLASTLYHSSSEGGTLFYPQAPLSLMKGAKKYAILSSASAGFTRLFDDVTPFLRLSRTTSTGMIYPALWFHQQSYDPS